MGTAKRNLASAALKSLSTEDIAAYLDYNYIPFKKTQCVGRIFIVLLSGAGLCLIRERSLLWAVPVGLLSLLITAAFIVLMVRFSRLRISRYLCDGIFGLYIAVIMNLGAYRCTALQAGSSVLRLIAMLGLLLIWAAAFAAITVSWIRAGKFSSSDPSKPNFWLPGLFVFAGMGLARVFLQGRSQQTVFAVITVGLLVLSLVMGVTGSFLLKAWFCAKHMDE
ncbi:MAG: hypothetical protein U0I98_08150 [Oscillospiraceae bacterium]|jgi:membrane protein|nr:hypothetical protein [Oscillospiraceae bacterium]